MIFRKRRPDESKEDYNAMISRGLKSWREAQERMRKGLPPFINKDKFDKTITGNGYSSVEKSTPIQRIGELYEQRKPEPSSVLSDVFGQRLRDLANITYLDPETGRRSGDRPVLPTGLNAFLPVGARPNSAADLSSLSVAMKPNPFSNEILRGLAFNPEGEEMENMMGFRPLRYAEGTGPQGVTMEDAAPQAMDGATRAATIEYIATSLGMNPDSLMGLSDEQLMAARAKVEADMMAAQQQQMNMMEFGTAADVGAAGRMPTGRFTGFLEGLDEAPSLGMGVTQNPGFDPQTQTYSPPERRANGGIMSLRVR